MYLKATKSFRYKGRALVPGDPFIASRRDGRALLAVRRAEVDNGAYVAPKPTTRTKVLDHDRNGRAGGCISPGPSANLQAARAEYTRVTGKRFFAGWNERELADRTAKHIADQAHEG